MASPSQGRTAAAQCGLFTYKSVPVIFEPPCTLTLNVPSLGTVELFLFIKSQFTKKAQNILHLSQRTYGHV